ncbi:MAG: tetratricopeptide repeat protein [Gemmatimonadetes bacterium]|nr:tetratricopeptide repeat protein [Gemmatimonadota bacterium]NIQ55389.1 tetratricopeptide repeat protein [Gemmatimonadota bacterium]NIU75596.1 tetratricopeptide repeat protein [Gammaproteobacteria bacterium]NIX45286.1 tetratricopeptide repeat protein [Gemmatimonadota bacterium]NIY09569.1 tetratricopeptide repeat protein [Gemmatimonadota bacterium]
MSGPEPMDVEAVLRQALELGEQGRWQEMASLLSESLEREQDDPYLLCWLGVAEGELDNDGAAYEAFRRCVDQDPSDPHVLALAGSGLAQFDDPDAETALRAAALSAPDLPLARLNYGAYLSRAGMHDEALEQLAAARELTPDDPVVRAELGAAHVLRGDPAAGVDELEQALALAPEDSWTRVLYGLVLLELERAEEAAEELVRAAREREHDAESIVLGALAAGIQGWEDAAEDLLARAEYAAEGADVQLLQEAESALRAGEEATRRLLRSTVAPSALRERLQQPL